MVQTTTVIKTVEVAGDTQDETTVNNTVVETLPLVVRAASCQVDFGGGSDIARTTITGQTWVLDESRLVAGFFGSTDDNSAEDVLLNQLSVVVDNIVEGVGFDVVAHAPSGAFGKFNVHVIGV